MQAQPGSRSPRFHLLLSFLIVLSLPHLIGAESILGDNNTCDNAHILERNADCDPQRAAMTWNTTKETTANTGAKMYGYRYPQVPLEVDNYPVGPEGLQLEQVHVYVRHGERTPVGVRLTDPPASIPEYWMMCKTARRFRAAVSSALGPSPNQAPHLSVRNDELEETLQTQKVVERKDGTLVEGECLLGELTDLGRQSTYSFGQNLRRLYVERLGFIPDTLPSSDIVYFRSTNMPRTIESLQQVVHGLYPTNKCLDGAQPPLRIRNGKDENLIGNTYACKRLEILQAGFANAAAQAYNRSLERLDKKVSKYLNGNPIRVDGKPRASGIMDTIRASIAHGIKVPPEFEDKTIVDVIDVCSTLFLPYGHPLRTIYALDKTEEVRRLAMGRLLDDMSRKMQTKIQQREADPLKILVHSTHDTAIAGLCSTFDVFDDKWPAFTASITFELFKTREPESDQTRSQSILTRMGSPSSSSQYYVRMRHQNKDMTLPICAQSGNHLEGHPEFCTFSAFKARVKELTPTEWDDECLPAGKP
ncbi:putative acid phosphatase SPBC4.06 [Psilocybe cubensis]|uniref:Acid phosphatase SPBC4.06 n=1 Tax=Psilocybe cubensis TaxID=181762 RepID=A0ACB8GQZ7_PSICU|nr:putative acid phosphatase SPBC4.06 [Psilocybe cubensis]KAH9477792.1 putative acid phosphatase SPBC4.06 [Psilocybe cubensis]